MTTLTHPNKSHVSPRTIQLDADVMALLTARSMTIHEMLEHVPATRSRLTASLDRLRVAGRIVCGRRWVWRVVGVAS